MQQTTRLLPPGSFRSPVSSSSTILLPQLDGAPPHKIPVRSGYARVAPTEPGDPFPSISPRDQARVKNWIERDVDFERELADARQRKRTEINAFAEDVVTGQDWLGPPGPPGQFKIRWDDDKDREQASKSRGPLRRPVKLSKRQLRSAASRSEVLIPIRLDIDHEAWKLRDTFTWNLLETDITPETFASHLCADLRLPERPFMKEIITTIKKAIEDAEASDRSEAPLADGSFEHIEASREWFEERAFEKRGRPVMDGLTEEGEASVGMSNGAPDNAVGDELRVTIKLDITLDATQLVDRIEWDITDPRNSPEEFAENFAAELGLTGEFRQVPSCAFRTAASPSLFFRVPGLSVYLPPQNRTAIAHSIREQVDTYVKSLALLNYASSGSITDDDLRREFLPAVQDVFRWETADLYSPALIQLSNEDVDRNEKEREREVRRKRRQTKGRGITLPDREAVKTHRTLVPRPLPGLMQIQMNGGDVVYPTPELAHPYPLLAKPVPPKPEGIETSDSAPLRLLVKERDAPSGPSQPLRGAALANAIAKRARLAGLERAEPQPILRPEDFGLHPHLLDGVWHCANCGVPESLAIGRRKGPTGIQNLCGACGKHYNRFRRQRICEYTTDYNFHAAARAKEESNKEATKPHRGNRGTASVATTSTEGTPAALGVQPPSRGGPPQSSVAATGSSLAVQIPSVRTGKLGADDDEDDEGNSDDSDPVRAPVRKKRRPNHYGSPDTPFVANDSNSGTGSDDSDEDDEEGHHEPNGPSPPTRPEPPPTQIVVPRPPPPSLPSIQVDPIAPVRVPVARPEPLPWMIAAASELRARQVDDRFELIPKPKVGDPSSFEWRIRCLDCPGKLYNLGPGQSFDGFLVHFKNRNHRTNVENRLAAAANQQQPSHH